MTQIIITIDDNSPVTLIKKAIGLLKGVTRVVVHKSPDSAIEHTQNLDGIPDDIQSLIGVASKIDPEDLTNDDKLAYILSK